MKKTEPTPERQVREIAYNGRDFTYHSYRENDFAGTSWWYFLKGVKELDIPTIDTTDTSVDPNDLEALEARAEALKKLAKDRGRLNKLRSSLGESASGLLVNTLDKAITRGTPPRNARLFLVRASCDNDDLGLGQPTWDEGLAAAVRKKDALTLDIALNPKLTEDETIRHKAISFVAGAVALKCIPYDRGQKHPLRSILVQPAPNMLDPFPEFDFVLEQLQRDQKAELASFGGGSGQAMKAGLAALRAVHEQELASLGVS